MSNDLMNNMLTEHIMEKAIRDKIQQQQSEQQAADRKQQAKLASKKALQNSSDEDSDFDEEALEIYDKMKQERMQTIMEMKMEKAIKQERNVTNGEYREIVEEEFLRYTTKNQFICVHFYHKDFQKCKIIDKHLRLIAQLHTECVFVNINSEKCPFFITKLQIQCLPTLCFFNNGKLVDRLIGFEGLSESGDDFPTILLSRRIIKSGICVPKTDQERGPKINKKGKGKNYEESDSDDDDY